MTNQSYFYLLFALIVIPLIVASYHDVKNRHIPIKTWILATYIGIPVSFLIFATQFLDGNVLINNLEQMFGVVYTIIIIILLYIISSFTEKYIPQLKMGGADFIALTIILITSIPISMIFTVFYMKVFIGVALATITISLIYNGYKKKPAFSYIIPLILPITIAYIMVMVGYFVVGYQIFVMY